MASEKQTALLTKLVDKKIITQDQLDSIFIDSKKKNLSVIQHLLAEKLLPSTELAKLIAQSYQLRFTDLRDYQFDQTLTSLVASKLLRRYRVLPLKQEGQHLLLATNDPESEEALMDIQFHTGFKTLYVVAESNKLNQLVDKLLTNKASLTIEIEEASTENHHDKLSAFVEKIIHDAVKQRASDIHFEPYQHYYRIRYRIDGVLQEIVHPPKQVSARINARLKVLAKLDISEKRQPQDGRFEFTVETKTIDCRLHTCPTYSGEKATLRLLNKNHIPLDIHALGLSPKQQQFVLTALQQPQGMMLVTGPTGSGKSTTLYTALHFLNTPEKNISTIEDPVEITLEGVNQVPIQPKIGLHFSTILRAFLRQDPDIIMVGEIRDHDTADIAIKAAQTGHLLLSTLHTNCAAATVTRLLNLGIAPDQLASALNIIIAQRLLRKPCQYCSTTTLEKSQGCEYCYHGFQGRTAVFEILPCTTAIKNLIAAGADEKHIHQVAVEEGMQTLYQSALEKVNQGSTTQTEVQQRIVMQSTDHDDI